jgi:hypothetical protein
MGTAPAADDGQGGLTVSYWKTSIQALLGNYLGIISNSNPRPLPNSIMLDSRPFPCCYRFRDESVH